jgi:threonine dehydrogenase-like Zn-dependent dehydrogenase
LILPGTVSTMKAMRALTVRPGDRGSARIEELPEPPEDDGGLLVRTIAVGVCGTDLEIVQGAYGSAPEGDTRLVLGHESLGEVVEAPPGTGFLPGDLVVGIVRRPDPVPCLGCAVGEWDMCRNGLYTERGIKGRHGYASEMFRVEPEFAVRLDPDLGLLGVLLGPASVLAKAWEQVEAVGGRIAEWEPQVVLVTGAGPVGLLAALIGVQRGLEVHVFDRVTDGRKPALVHELGAHYHGGSLDDLQLEPDVVIECTGAGSVVFDVANRTGPTGVTCLTGLSSAGRKLEVDLAQLNRSLVLENGAVVGSVNANQRHYEAAAAALERADRHWLQRLITRAVPLASYGDALRREPDDVKVVLDFRDLSQAH